MQQRGSRVPGNGARPTEIFLATSWGVPMFMSAFFACAGAHVVPVTFGARYHLTDGSSPGATYDTDPGLQVLGMQQMDTSPKGRRVLRESGSNKTGLVILAGFALAVLIYTAGATARGGPASLGMAKVSVWNLDMISLS